MEPNEPVSDKATATPEETQGVQLGDATPLESAPESPASEEAQPDESVLSMEERNIMNSPNIAAPTTGPSEEEIAEKKHQEEMAKLDELKPLVNETLIDDGKSMERKKRLPLVVTLIIVAIIAVAGIAGVLLYTSQPKPQKDIPQAVIVYTEEVKVAVDSRLKNAYSEVANSITNFENITVNDIDYREASEALNNKKNDLVISEDYTLESTDPSSYNVKVTPFLNDAIVAIASPDFYLDNLSFEDIAKITTRQVTDWNEIAVDASSEETELSPRPIHHYQAPDEYIVYDMNRKITEERDSVKFNEAATDMASLIDNIANDKDGIAFVYLSSLSVDDLNKIKVLDLEGVSATNDNVADASYALTIKYYIISNKNLEEDSVPAAYIESLKSSNGNTSGMKVPIVTEEPVEPDCKSESTDDAETKC